MIPFIKVRAGAWELLEGRAMCPQVWVPITQHRNKVLVNGLVLHFNPVSRGWELYAVVVKCVGWAWGCLGNLQGFSVLLSSWNNNDLSSQGCPED